MNINASIAISCASAVMASPPLQVRVKVASGTFYGFGDKTSSGEKPNWDIISAAKKYPERTHVTVLKIRVVISQNNGVMRKFEITAHGDIAKLTTTDPDHKEQKRVIALKKYLARMIGHTFMVGDSGPAVEKGYNSKGVNFDVFDFYVANGDLARLLGRIELSVRIIAPKK